MSDQDTQDFRITRLENEVDFFRKTTEQSLVENGKKINRILNVLEADENLGKKGLVQEVEEVKVKMVSLRNFLNAYKLAIAMLAAFFSAVGAVIGWYLNLHK
jgi:hypothetical protein